MNTKVKLAIVSLCLCYLSISVGASLLPPLTNMTLPQVFDYLKYPHETHFITTEDGYILQFFRVQSKKSKTIQQGLPVLYFQHGLEDSSDTACLNNEDRAPCLMFANAGYDVWLGNSRGNRYSKNHTTLSVSDPKFWEFSFQEMGMYDLPAAFQYISAETGKKINYVGHSQGTIQMFLALSRREQVIMDNLNVYIALGPVAWVADIQSAFLKQLANNIELIDLIVASGTNQFLAFQDNEVLANVCLVSPATCGKTLQALMDMNTSYDNLERMDVFVGHLPAGTSVQNIRHWAQNIRSGEFNYFDYGKLRNLLEYGTPIPPRIKVEDINVPIHLFAGITDELADVQDVQRLYTSLVGSPKVTLNQYPFGHASFLIGKDMSYIKDVFAVLDQYNQVKLSDN